MELRKVKDKATEAFAKGKFAKAAAFYQEYCEADPKDLQARLRMGDAWAKAGQKDKAIAAYRAAAEGYAREGFLPRAIAASKLILELDPGHKAVQSMLAELYARRTSGDGKAKPPPPPAARAEPEAVAAHRPDAIELPAMDDTPVELELASPVTPAAAPPAPPATFVRQAAPIEIELDPALSDGQVLELDSPVPVGVPPVSKEVVIDLDSPKAGKTPVELELGEAEVLEADVLELEPEPASPRPEEPSVIVDASALVVAPPGVAALEPLDPLPEPVPLREVKRPPEVEPSGPPLRPSGRFWVPQASPDAPAPVNGASQPEAAVASLPGAEKRSDIQAGLAALSRFDELDLDDAGVAFVAPQPPPIVAASEPQPEFEVEAAAPPAPEPAEARAPARLPSFTELELEGDSLLHAVEAAARAGVEHGAASGPSDDELVIDEVHEAPAPGVLPKIPLFSDLSPDAFIELFERCPLRRVTSGERIIEQGSVGDSFFVICAGTVKVYRTDAGQRRDIVTLEEGAFFGEVALLSDAPRTASVEAASEDTQLLEISAPVLAQLSLRYPQVASALKKFCRQRLLSNLMATSALFRPFNKKDRRELVEKFRAREVQKGEVVLREGERGDGLYIVLSGEVEVRKDSRALAHLKEGEIFGEMSLLQKTPASATVCAAKRTSLLRLPRQDFDGVVLSHPQILVLISELNDDRRRQNEALVVPPSASTDEPLVLV